MRRWRRPLNRRVGAGARAVDRSRTASRRPRSRLGALAANDVEFVLIGGFGVGFHGYPRATKDIDIVPEPSRANLTRLT